MHSPKDLLFCQPDSRISSSVFSFEKAHAMSMHALEQYVRDFKKLDTFAPRAGQENPEKAHQQAISNFSFEGEAGVLPLENHEPESTPKTLVAMELSSEILQKFEKLKGKNSWEVCDEQIEATKPQAVKTTSRYIPAAIENYVIKLTNGTSAFPPCTRASRPHRQRRLSGGRHRRGRENMLE